MSYQVLARKWRPRTFDEMVGQEFVLRALINALDHDRLHHAYLFTGTRGVGKTTLARILSKCLNCETGVTSKPCGKCTSCREIDDGRFVDLIEVDAASRTRVEETRELLENVQYTPTRGRYKVYLIDEVHMFSAHSFNALLKTLEEPPPHVKFLLATTDPQKLPVTILSRCLQFNLKRLPIELIRGHLKHILGEEGVPFEAPALVHLARGADGSMRDALSLLDQAIAFGGGRLTDDEVRTMLGTIERQYVLDLLAATAGQDGQAVIDVIGRMSERAPDFTGVLAELISTLQRVALAQVVPEAIDDSYGDREAVLGLAARMSTQDVQLYYQIALIGRRDLDLSPDPRSGFEMVMLRMLAFRPEAVPQEGEAPPPKGRKPAAARPAAQALAASSKPPASANAAAGVAAAAEAPPGGTAPADADWERIVASLDLGGLERELALNCARKGEGDNPVTLVLDPSLANLRKPKLTERLQQAVSKRLGRSVRVVIELAVPETETPAQARERLAEQQRQAAAAAIDADPVVQALQDRLGGRVEPGSVRSSD